MAPSRAGDKITVFTTRIDTIYGATSIQLAPEHPLVAELVGNDPHLHSKVEDLIREQARAREAGDIGGIEKHGVFTGRYAINPFNRRKGADLGGQLHLDGLWHRRDHVRSRA